MAVQVSFEGEIRAELMNLDILQELWGKFGCEGEGDSVLAGDFGSVEEKKFVDGSRRESSAVERGAGFEENT